MSDPPEDYGIPDLVPADAISFSEAAEILGCHLTWIYKAVDQGLLKSYKLVGRKVVSRAEVVVYKDILRPKRRRKSADEKPIGEETGATES